MMFSYQTKKVKGRSAVSTFSQAQRTGFENDEVIVYKKFGYFRRELNSETELKPL